jgi:hypothetical protein
MSTLALTAREAVHNTRGQSFDILYLDITYVSRGSVYRRDDGRYPVHIFGALIRLRIISRRYRHTYSDIHRQFGWHYFSLSPDRVFVLYPVPAWRAWHA